MQAQSRVVFFLLLSCAAGCSQRSLSSSDAEPSPSSSESAAPQEPPPKPVHVPIPTGISQLMAKIPQDLGALDPQIPNPAPDAWNFHLMGWLTFIALNWPAQSNACEPDLDASITGDSAALRVWQTWARNADVLLAPGQQVKPGQRPMPWCPSKRAAPVFTQVAKIPGPSIPMAEQAIIGPLVDQNRRFVRYEVAINKDAYDFILKPGASDDSNLWSIEGQNAYVKSMATPGLLQFPSGKAGGAVGAIAVQAAWKVLNADEIKSKRYSMISDVKVETGGMGLQKVTLGLIGMHIAHKTETAPQWIWSTFEHVDNILSPVGGGGTLNSAGCGQVVESGAKAPQCTGGCCTPNTPTVERDAKKKGQEELTAEGKPKQRAVQVVRAHKSESQEIKRMNEAFRRLLAGTAWSNYTQIGTQWPSEPWREGGKDIKTPEEDVKPEPQVLANVAIETFNQGPVEAVEGGPAYPYKQEKGAGTPYGAGARSSCIGCHSVAAVAGEKDGVRYADFLMMLGHARKVGMGKEGAGGKR